MAYLAAVTYDDGGRVQSLDGMDAFYDNGRTRNLLGAHLAAVSYDDGGRFRSLYGLGDASTDLMDVTDLPLAPPSSFMPIENLAPSIAPPSPIVDTTPTEITGSLVAPGGPSAMPIFYQPLVNVDTQSAANPGALTPPPAAAAASAQPVQILNAASSALTSIFSGIRNVFSSTGATVRPASAGTIVGTVSPAGTVGSSWFSQPSALGVPNWGMLVGIGVGGIVLISMLGKSSSTAGARRRNGMELILMGANPSRRWR
jgi:hypothetical protein